MMNIRVVAIPYQDKDLAAYVRRVNGLQLPSGGAFASTQREYQMAAKRLLELAKEENDGGNQFPVWGGCMGMQQMMIAAEGNDRHDTLLEKFDSHNNLQLPLKFTEVGRESAMFANFTRGQRENMERRKCSLHNHMMGLSPEKFQSLAKLNAFYDVIQTSRDRDGREFVSTIAGKKQPFQGVQWHPERKANFTPMVRFFRDEVAKSTRVIQCGGERRTRRRRLQTRKIPCMKQSNSLQKTCNFQWERTDGENNPRTCDRVARSRGEDGRIQGAIG